MKNFKRLVDSILSTMPMIVLGERDIERVDKRSAVIAVAKGRERGHIRDPGQREIRFNNGIFGEIAVEQFLGIKFADLTVGPSVAYYVPDMKSYGLDVGIKTSDYQRDNTIMIPREGTNADESLEPQIVVIRFSNRVALIAGYATVEVLRKYRDDYYLKDQRARYKKTGFYGYNYLVPFNTLDELRELAKGD